jgi:hypothetical protein
MSQNRTNANRAVHPRWRGQPNGRGRSAGVADLHSKGSSAACAFLVRPARTSL